VLRRIVDDGLKSSRKVTFYTRGELEQLLPYVEAGAEFVLAE